MAMADGPPRNERAFHHVRGQVTRGLQDAGKIRNLYALAETTEEEPVIPDPSLFTVRDTAREPASPTSSPSWKTPSVPECAIHLEFLNILYVLKCNVLSSSEIDKTMGYTSITRPLQSKLEQWQAGKWSKFVEFAILRFLNWAAVINNQMAQDYSQSHDWHRAGVDLLAEAPLDVLMVWAALMLNPGLYRQHYGEKPIYQRAFPWEAIHSRTDNKTWLYEQQSIGETIMEQMHLPQDLLEQFKQWPFPEKQSIGHKYIGLKAFKFGEGAVGTTNGADPQHDKTTERHAKLFGEVDVSLAMQLKDAVEGQEAFIEKMADFMWLRSPAVEGTLRRSIDRYARFMELVKRNPGTKLAPTQDIALVWNTHQCMGGQYAQDMETHVGRNVDSDDWLGSKELGPGYERTEKLFWERFGQEYRVCGCWDCELLINEVEKLIHLDADRVDMEDISRRAEKTLLFYRSVEIMRRHGERLPAWP